MTESQRTEAQNELERAFATVMKPDAAFIVASTIHDLCRATAVDMARAVVAEALAAHVTGKAPDAGAKGDCELCHGTLRIPPGHPEGLTCMVCCPPPKPPQPAPGCIPAPDPPASAEGDEAGAIVERWETEVYDPGGGGLDDDVRAPLVAGIAHALKSERETLRSLLAEKLREATEAEARAEAAEAERDAKESERAATFKAWEDSVAKADELRRRLAAWEPVVRAAIQDAKDGILVMELLAAVEALPPEFRPQPVKP